MLHRLFHKLGSNRSRLTWPGFALVLLLQRSPLPWVIAELQFSLGPRLIHTLKWVVGAGITSAFYHTVTGATGDLSTIGSTSGVVGENMQVAVRAEKAVPVTVELEGTLPPGLISNIGVGGAIPNGVIAFSGIPTEAGQFPVTLTVLTWESKSTYEGVPIQGNFTFSVTLEGPEITKHPVSIVVPWGTTAQLSVGVANEEGVSYQWQSKTAANPNSYADIEGATESVYSAPNATKALEGSYLVRVTRNELTETSNAAFLTVKESDYDSWRKREFENPADNEAGESGNPDGDAFTNAFEFFFNLDPEVPDSIQAPEISHERIGNFDYVVFAFPPVVGGPNLDYAFEATNNLVNGPWLELIHGVDNVWIEQSAAGSLLKMPYAPEVYCRMRIDTGG